MGERKVLNKYIPADFDPRLVPKVKRDWSKPVEVRMMLPFSLRCNTCGEYMYRGKKFNSRKEDVKGEDYLGIRKFRFYIKCVVCSAEITFKTDPKHGDYEIESGASRNFEAWRDPNQHSDDENEPSSREDKVDAIAALENRTIDSKNEMDILDALDELKAINQRLERVDTDKLLELLDRKRMGVAEATGDQVTDEEAKALEEFRKRRIKRLDEDDDDEEVKNGDSATGSGLVASNGAGSTAAAEARVDFASGSAAAIAVKPAAATAPSAAAAGAKASNKPKITFVKRKKVSEASSGNDSAKKLRASAPSAPTAPAPAPAPAPAVAVAAAAPAAVGALPLSAYGSDSEDEKN